MKIIFPLRVTALLLSLLGAAHALVVPPACSGASGTNGPIKVTLTPVPRVAGISPYLQFFNATTTTYSAKLGGAGNTFQDLSYIWNFGDSGASGTENWLYGTNPGKNSKNTATGAVAAHLYICPPGKDCTYTPTVTVTDGTHTVYCAAPVVTAYDPNGVNGYAGKATTCVSSASLPVAGSNGCPAGAAVLLTSSESTALGAAHMGSGKRVLFECGDRFSGNVTIPVTIGGSIGAYNGCEGTQTNRPIFGGGISIPMNTGDVRVSDIDCENTSSGNCVISTNNYDYIPYQITLWNLKSAGNNASFYGAQTAQWGLIQLVQTGMGTQQGTFLNYAGNNASQWKTNSKFNNLQYLAIMGGSYSGAGAPNSSAGIETVRISQGQYEVYTDDLFENANDVGATFKFHAANNKDDINGFSGMYNEYVEISDTLFYGTSGAQLAEASPQNVDLDERIRYVVLERDIFRPTEGSHTGLALSASYATVRDSAFNGANQNGVQIAERYSGSPAIAPVGVEIYNNACAHGGTCAVFGSGNWAGGPAGTDSFAANNLCYETGSCVAAGKGNTVSNNTTNVSANPGFTDASGTFLLIPDWKPTAAYSGGTEVPVVYDALGDQWSPTWSLGAVRP